MQRDNIDRLRRLRDDLPYRSQTWALTGKLNPDGSVNADTRAGLDESHMWVRVGGARAETRALIGPGMYLYYADYDERIKVGFNAGGELVAIEPMVDLLATYARGGALPSPEKRNDPLPSRLVMGLRVLPPSAAAPQDGDVYIFLEAEPSLGWLGGHVNVTAGIPANAGEFGWTSVYWDNTAQQPGIFVHAPEVKPNIASLSIDKQALIAALPYNVTPAGAVALYNGQTLAEMRSGSRYEDLRTFPNKKHVEVSQIMISAEGNLMIDADGFIMVAT